MDEKGNGHFHYPPYVRIVTFSRFPSFWFGFKPRWMETLTPPHTVVQWYLGCNVQGGGGKVATAVTSASQTTPLAMDKQA